MIPSFKDFLKEKQIVEKIMLFEHIVYKQIDGTKNSYRQDTGNTNNMTITHSHVYAKPNGNGKELYSVNIDGSTHDGYSGTEVPKKHADFFRTKGYEIKHDNILECLFLESLNKNDYEIIILEESEEN
ncbi:hypothetical protein [Sulfurimonas sp.]|uniref:hypothetical protein n=1 Tax=Sulfurimonas sp. TaxID=2022749 RepID=UPI0026160CE7|nr:hypothetical protein [Sulfurimonas sp.]MDD5157871.1 hypothetical protein [Sulfurimonas sp.]